MGRVNRARVDRFGREGAGAAEYIVESGEGKGAFRENAVSGSTGTFLGPVHWIADLETGGGARGLERVAGPLLAAGLPSLQLRGPGRSTEELIEAGRGLRRLAERAGARFVVNGNVEAARRLAANGLHLPARGPDVEAARRSLPAGVRVGKSVHDADELSRAAGADWLLVSPVFPTESKPGAATLGVDGLAALVEAAGPGGPPIWALGGIDAARVPACRAAGATGVAAIRALLGAEAGALLRAAGVTPPR
jgi:thiamine-phosphate pyrophosphorylase